MAEPDLDDPEYAAFAWGRFRRILGWMTVLAVMVGLAGVAILWWWMGEMQLATALATGFGFFFTIEIAAALMGLMFLSSGSGHDARVEDPLKDEVDLD
jgi:hypothetical protein